MRGNCFKPVHKLRYLKRMAALAKAKGDVITQTVIAQKDFEVRYFRMGVQRMWCADAKHLFMPFGEDALVAHHRDSLPDLIIVDEFSIAKDHGPDAKQFVKLFGMLQQDRKSTRLNSSHVKISYA